MAAIDTFQSGQASINASASAFADDTMKFSRESTGEKGNANGSCVGFDLSGGTNV
jgi:hypothetical protein